MEKEIGVKEKEMKEKTSDLNKPEKKKKFKIDLL